MNWDCKVKLQTLPKRIFHSQIFLRNELWAQFFLNSSTKTHVNLYLYSVAWLLFLTICQTLAHPKFQLLVFLCCLEVVIKSFILHYCICFDLEGYDAPSIEKCCHHLVLFQQSFHLNLKTCLFLYFHLYSLLQSLADL